MSRALLRMMTKRGNVWGNPPADADGRVGAKSTILSNWACTPPDPIDPRNGTAERLGVASPVTLHQTIGRYHALIERGEKLVIDGVSYAVKGVGDYDGWTQAQAGERFVVLYLEKPVR